MGRLKRYTADHPTMPLWAIEYRGIDDPPILDDEKGLVEIVDADGLDKPESQLQAEAAAVKAAMLAELQALPAAQTIEGYSERARILFAMEAANASRAATAALRGAILAATSLSDLKQRVQTLLPNAPAQLNEEDVAASLAAKQAQAIGE